MDLVVLPALVLHMESNGASTSSTSKPSAPGRKAGAAAGKVAKGTEDACATTTSEGAQEHPEVTNSTASGDKDGGRSGGSDASSSGHKTAKLLHEATQLLKTIRIHDGTPKLKVMQLTNSDQTDKAVALIDSGATHALRPARDEDEWNK